MKVTKVFIYKDNYNGFYFQNLGFIYLQRKKNYLLMVKLLSKQYINFEHKITNNFQLEKSHLLNMVSL